MSESSIEKIPQHHHCVECGKAFVGKGMYCSEACEEASQKEIKGKVRKLGIIWLAIIIVTGFLVFAVL